MCGIDAEHYPIDYVYLRERHCAQVNDLLRTHFWPGIDGMRALYVCVRVCALYMCPRERERDCAQLINCGRT